MSTAQETLLLPPPPRGRFLTFALRPGADAAEALRVVGELALPAHTVIGLGAPFLAAAGRVVLGLRAFPCKDARVAVPSTQGALWLFLGGDDDGVLVHRCRALVASLARAFTLEEDTATFVFDGGRDLTGYEDGTENPKDERAREVAFDANGASFVAVQRWVHDLAGFEVRSPEERDHVIGRAKESNEELADAPVSAHVKRSAQESFEPDAFMLRRSMPFGDAREQGLYFVAYGERLDRFERVLDRMIGLEDGVVDALFSFSRPVTGGYYWCPPCRDGRVDLTAATLRA